MTYADKVKNIMAALDGSGGYDSEEEWATAILKSIGILPHYDPETLLLWAAEHLVIFRPAIDTAYLEYVGEDGETYHLTWISKVHQPETIHQLYGCIELAMGQEAARKRLTVAPTEDKRASTPQSGGSTPSA